MFMLELKGQPVCGPEIQQLGELPTLKKGTGTNVLGTAPLFLGTMVIVGTSFESTLWDIDLEFRDSDPDSLGHC